MIGWRESVGVDTHEGLMVVLLEIVGDSLVWRRAFIWTLVFDYVMLTFLELAVTRTSLHRT